MITIFKIFENNTQPQIGDYVIMGTNIDDNRLEEFLDNNIGKIVNLDTFIDVEYENINHYNKYDITWYFSGKNNNRRTFTLEKIIKIFKNKDDANTYLTSKKYNL